MLSSTVATRVSQMGRTGAVNTHEDHEPGNRSGRCANICAPVLDVFLPWLIGELVPFGDLVTDIWLWLILPAAMPDAFDCSEDTYKVNDHAHNLAWCR